MLGTNELLGFVPRRQAMGFGSNHSEINKPTDNIINICP